MANTCNATFTESHNWSSLRQSILERWKLPGMRTHQEQAIRTSSEALGLLGDEACREAPDGLMLTLPTGSGKSLCFMAPAGELNGISLVLYPLNALLRDQLRKYERAGIPCQLFYGALDPEEKAQSLQAIRSMQRGVIITNPESAFSSSLLPLLCEKDIGLLAIDEAHLVLQWGLSFRENLLKATQIRGLLGNPFTIACTATISREDEQLLCSLLWTEEIWEKVELLCDRPNIHYRVLNARNQRFAIRQLLEAAIRGSGLPWANISEEELQFPMIVFVTRRQLARELAGRSRIWFRQWGDQSIQVMYYHAGLDSPRRKEIERQFAGSKRAIIFTTKAFGTGVDIASVRCCIHLEAPETLQDFLQESGRAGRDGDAAYSILIQGSRKMFPPNLCRRNVALAGIDQTSDSCSGCDICDATELPLDLELAAADALSRQHRLSGFPIDELLRG